MIVNPKITEFASIDFKPAVLILMLASYAIIDSLSVRYIAGQRILYALLILMSIIVVLLCSYDLKLSSKQAIFISFWIIIVNLYLLPAMTQPVTYPKYIIGDFSCFILPIFLLIVGFRYPEFFKVRPSLYLLGLFLFVAVFVSIFLGQRVNNRFEAPPTLLIPIGFIAFGAVRKISYKIIIGSFLVLLFLINFRSGERTGLALWAISFIYILYIDMNLSKIFICIILCVLLVFTPIFISLKEKVTDIYLNESRFKYLASGQIDASIQNRIMEGRDALVTMRDHGSIVNIFLGFGHGASYYPDHSYIERNVSPDGLVHHIHIGPVLIFFRYGTLGVLLYISLIMNLIWTHMKNYFIWREKDINYADIIFSLSLTLYLISGLLRNVFVDPFFSYTLAGYFYYRINTK